MRRDEMRWKWGDFALFPDINECLLGASNCRGGERCINTEGSFRCQREVSCGTGYELTDNNHCKGELSYANPASVHTVCKYRSRLFKALWFLWCIYPDIDECETEIHNCGKEFACQNTQGSFRCLPKVKCGAGFIQDALGNCIGEQLLTATHGNFTHKSCVSFLHAITSSTHI